MESSFLFLCLIANLFIYTPPPKMKLGGGGYTGISLLGARSVHKILSGQLLLQFQSNSLDTWQKCSLGAVDVQDTNFVKIPSRTTELLPMI